MDAVSVMHAGSQALCFGIALVAFIVAAIVSVRDKGFWAACISVGLAAWVFVLFWNALALS